MDILQFWNIIHLHILHHISAFSCQIRCIQGIQHLRSRTTSLCHPGVQLTWSCCSWTPSQEILHGWGIENTGYWHYRRFPGSMAGPLWRAWPCWGSGLEKRTQCWLSSTQAFYAYLWTGMQRGTQDITSPCLSVDGNVFGYVILTHIHVDDRVDWLFSATRVPWTTKQATWSPWRNAPGRQAKH